jgi:N-acetylmuramic acid 6-phosphate etherase
MELDLLETHRLVSVLAKDHQQAITAVEGASQEIADFIDALTKRMREGGRLIYLGCGTSGRLGVLDAAECPPTFQTDTNLVIGLIAGGDKSLKVSSEGEEDKPDGAKFALTELNLTRNDTVLGIAAGGTTPWVIGGIQLAKEMGASNAFLTCSSEAPVCGHIITLKTGAEPLTGSTRMKAATATKLTLNIITTAIFTRLGKVHVNLMVDLHASNTKLLDRAIRILCLACDLPREEAHALLLEANGVVKVAILMDRKKIDAKTAQQLLHTVGGILRAAL